MFDKDGDGAISMHELVNGLRILTKGTESEKLKFLFDVYDIDGKLSFLHFITVPTITYRIPIFHPRWTTILDPGMRILDFVLIVTWESRVPF